MTCRSLWSLAREKIENRYNALIAPFVRMNIKQFNLLTYSHQLLITGSCALSMVLPWSGHQPRDLNLLVPVTGFEDVNQFLIHELAYVRVASTPHPAVKSHVAIFEKYQKGPRFVTVASAFWDKDFLEIPLASPTTAEMIVMTAGAVAIFYPDLTLQKMGLTRQRGRGMTGTDALGNISELGFAIQDGNDFLEGPCGKLCPSLWHTPRDISDSPLKLLTWDTRFPVRESVRTSDVEWRLEPVCNNTACVNYTKRQGRSDFINSPSTAQEIDRQIHAIRTQKTVSAIRSLFAMNKGLG